MSVPRAIIYRKDNSPCFSCTERNVKCYSGCEKYKAYKDKIEKTKSDLKEKFKGRRMIEDFLMDKFNDIKLCEFKGKRRMRRK